MKYIDPLYFFIGLTIGLIYVYCTVPTPEVIIKFPTPQNSGKIIYKDKSENCYKYEANKVECPTNEKLIKAQPIIENFSRKLKRKNKSN